MSVEYCKYRWDCIFGLECSKFHNEEEQIYFAKFSHHFRKTAKTEKCKNPNCEGISRCLDYHNINDSYCNKCKGYMGHAEKYHYSQPCPDRFFCTKGNKCKLYHSKGEINYIEAPFKKEGYQKTKPCFFFHENGFCGNIDDCKYYHTDYDTICSIHNTWKDICPCSTSLKFLGRCKAIFDHERENDEQICLIKERHYNYALICGHNKFLYGYEVDRPEIAGFFPISKVRIL